MAEFLVSEGIEGVHGHDGALQIGILWVSQCEHCKALNMTLPNKCGLCEQAVHTARADRLDLAVLAMPCCYQTMHPS